MGNTRLAIDYVSLGILVVAFGITQIRTLSPRVGYFVWAAALFAVAGWRFTRGAEGMNLVISAVAMVLGLVNVARALRSPR